MIAVGRQGHVQVAATWQRGADRGRSPAQLVAHQIAADLAQLLAGQQNPLGAHLQPQRLGRAVLRPPAGLQERVQIEGVGRHADLVDLIAAAAHGEIALARPEPEAIEGQRQQRQRIRLQLQAAFGLEPGRRQREMRDLDRRVLGHDQRGVEAAGLAFGLAPVEPGALRARAT